MADDTTSNTSSEADTPSREDLSRPREGIYTGQMYEMSPEERQARNRRNIAIALGVVAFVVIIYATTLLRMSQGIGAGS